MPLAAQWRKPLRNCLASNVHLLASAPYHSVPERIGERVQQVFFWQVVVHKYMYNVKLQLATFFCQRSRWSTEDL